MKAARSFWTTCLTLIALSLASVAQCAPLLLPQDQIEPTHAVDETKHLSSNCENEQEQNAEPSNTSNNCCSSSSCYISVPFSLISHSGLVPDISLALIPQENSDPLSSFSRALYKPPIV